MRPTYPLTCFLLEPADEEQSTVFVRRGANGRIRTYDLGGYSDHFVTLTHSLVKRPVVEEVMQFWRANRGLLFNVQDEMGDHWVGAFTARPRKFHIDGPWYDVIVKLVRYEPSEGGL